MKRILALLLCLVMCVTMLPTAFAGDIELVDVEGEDLITIVEPDVTAPDVKTAGKPSIITQPSSKTARLGSTVTFTVKADGATSYQWYWRKDSSSSWNRCKVSGNTTASLRVEVTEARNGFQYKCAVRNDAGTTYTKVVTLTVTAKPVITTQPVSKTAYLGTTVKFSLKADGATSYQWYWRRNADASWRKTSVSGCTTAAITLEATEARNGYQYCCAVKNADGTTWSKSVTLTVSVKPVITAQPSSKTADRGETVKFSIKADGATLYQWYWRKNDDSLWAKSKLSGNTTSVLSVEATEARNGFQYKCRASNASGSVYSTVVKLTVLNEVKYRALLVGEVNFSWETANRNKGDVLRMKNLLLDSQGPKGGVYSVTCKYDLSAEGIKNAIGKTFAKADSNDVSLFFLATHGVVDVESGPYAGELVAIDDDGYSDYLTLGDLAACLKEVPGKVIVLLGSCGSGAAVLKNSAVSDAEAAAYADAFNEAVIRAFAEQDEPLEGDLPNTGEFRNSKFYVLTAANHMESSWGTEWGGVDSSYNYFTYYFVDGASGAMPADTDRDGTITLLEEYRYLQEYATGPYWDGSDNYYQHVNIYPANSTYPLFRYDTDGPTITNQPMSVYCEAGMTVKLSVKAKDADSYQWQYRENEISTWKNCTLTGSTTASLSVKAEPDKWMYEYRCRLTNAKGTVRSASATVDSYLTEYGENIDWVLTADGTLNLTGTGAMTEPWEFLNSDVQRIKIGSGITSLPENAFQWCGNVSSVTIPKSLTRIGSNAFNDCNCLSDVYYKGSQADWNSISISSGNGPLFDATIHYNA